MGVEASENLQSSLLPPAQRITSRADTFGHSSVLKLESHALHTSVSASLWQSFLKNRMARVNFQGTPCLCQIASLSPRKLGVQEGCCYTVTKLKAPCASALVFGLSSPSSFGGWPHYFLDIFSPPDSIFLCISSQQTFLIVGQTVNILDISAHTVSCQDLRGPPSECESIYRQYISEGVWPCSNREYLWTHKYEFCVISTSQ